MGWPKGPHLSRASTFRRNNVVLWKREARAEQSGWTIAQSERMLEREDEGNLAFIVLLMSSPKEYNKYTSWGRSEAASTYNPHRTHLRRSLDSSCDPTYQICPILLFHASSNMLCMFSWLSNALFIRLVSFFWSQPTNEHHFFFFGFGIANRHQLLTFFFLVWLTRPASSYHSSTAQFPVKTCWYLQEIAPPEWSIIVTNVWFPRFSNPLMLTLTGLKIVFVANIFSSWKSLLDNWKSSSLPFPSSLSVTVHLRLQNVLETAPVLPVKFFSGVF